MAAHPPVTGLYVPIKKLRSDKAAFTDSDAVLEVLQNVYGTVDIYPLSLTINGKKTRFVLGYLYVFSKRDMFNNDMLQFIQLLKDHFAEMHKNTAIGDASRSTKPTRIGSFTKLFLPPRKPGDDLGANAEEQWLGCFREIHLDNAAALLQDICYMYYTEDMLPPGCGVVLGDPYWGETPLKRLLSYTEVRGVENARHLFYFLGSEYYAAIYDSVAKKTPLTYFEDNKPMLKNILQLFRNAATRSSILSLLPNLNFIDRGLNQKKLDHYSPPQLLTWLLDAQTTAWKTIFSQTSYTLGINCVFSAQENLLRQLKSASGAQVNKKHPWLLDHVLFHLLIHIGQTSMACDNLTNMKHYIMLIGKYGSGKTAHVEWIGKVLNYFATLENNEIGPTLMTESSSVSMIAEQYAGCTNLGGGLLTHDEKQRIINRAKGADFKMAVATTANTVAVGRTITAQQLVGQETQEDDIGAPQFVPNNTVLGLGNALPGMRTDIYDYWSRNLITHIDDRARECWLSFNKQELSPIAMAAVLAHFSSYYGGLGMDHDASSKSIFTKTGFDCVQPSTDKTSTSYLLRQLFVVGSREMQVYLQSAFNVSRLYLATDCIYQANLEQYQPGAGGDKDDLLLWFIRERHMRNMMDLSLLANVIAFGGAVRVEYQNMLPEEKKYIDDAFTKLQTENPSFISYPALFSFVSIYATMKMHQDGSGNTEFILCRKKFVRMTMSEQGSTSDTEILFEEFFQALFNHIPPEYLIHIEGAEGDAFSHKYIVKVPHEPGYMQYWPLCMYVQVHGKLVFPGAERKDMHEHFLSRVCDYSNRAVLDWFQGRNPEVKSFPRHRYVCGYLPEELRNFTPEYVLTGGNRLENTYYDAAELGFYPPDQLLRKGCQTAGLSPTEADCVVRCLMHHEKEVQFASFTPPHMTRIIEEREQHSRPHEISTQLLAQTMMKNSHLSLAEIFRLIDRDEQRADAIDDVTSGLNRVRLPMS